MRTSDQVNELAAALSKAQGQFPPIERSRTVSVRLKAGGQYTFDYAPLDTILHAVVPHLSENGLELGFSPEIEYADDGRGEVATIKQTCRLTHQSGQWREASIALRTRETDPQGIGSTLTYGRRYCVEHVLAIAACEDDDGNAGSGNESEGRQRAPAADLPVCPKCETNESVIVGRPEYGGGYVCYGKKGGCGHKWQVVSDLAAQTGMTTGDKVSPPKNGNGNGKRKEDPDSAYREKYLHYSLLLTKCWMPETLTAILAKISHENNPALAEQLNLSMEAATRRAELLEVESFDDDDLTDVLNWMEGTGRTDTIDNLDKWVAELEKMNPRPVNDTQWTKIKRCHDRIVRKHAQTAGAK